MQSGNIQELENNEPDECKMAFEASLSIFAGEDGNDLVFHVKDKMFTSCEDDMKDKTIECVSSLIASLIWRASEDVDDAEVIMASVYQRVLDMTTRKKAASKK